MTDNNRIFFQEDAFSNWMEDGIVAERETEATTVEQDSQPAAIPVHESAGGATKDGPSECNYSGGGGERRSPA